MTSTKLFGRDATVVVLAAFALIEAASIIGISPSLTSIFTFPVNLITSSAIVVSSLLGMYGVFTNSRMTTYFSLLTPVTETILGLSFFIGALVEADFKSTLLLQGFLVVLLGFLGISLVSKILRQSKILWARTDVAGLGSVGTERYAVEVIDVVKKYIVGPVVVPAVNGLSMRVRDGEFVAVMGPSGCGKSTLLNLVGALDRPTSGRVFIDGIDISKMDSYALAQMRNEKVGFVFQAYNLINRSNVLRNVELPMLFKGISKERRMGRTTDMLNVVGLSNMPSRKPKTLSGGEQQRVAIARALVNNPRIVLADEPTGNLDSKAGMEILSFLKSTNKELGTTVIMVTHNREAAEMADRIVYLRDGRIEGEEPLERTAR